MLTERLDAFLRSPEFRDDVVYCRVEPGRPARLDPLPRSIDPRLLRALALHGVEALYSHQARATEASLAGRDVAVATGTASGKSLCYQLPLLNARLADRAATALLLFPTKALTRDQVLGVARVAHDADDGIVVGTYDGDTAPGERRRLREAGSVVATNPYMLHSGILPRHVQWGRFFSGLAYVVLDEMHGYTGVFGSHVANVIRRLARLCRHYGSDPRFIFCSATIKNPGELARSLLGRPVEVVADDGSPRGVKRFVHVNPPVVERERSLRRNVIDETRRVVLHFAPRGVKTILFAGSRNAVELLVRYLKEDYVERGLDPSRVRGYRGGYLPDLRRTIEEELREGELDVVVSTNALELGIDIGALDLCVIAGYPRARASFFQQAGRAGRRTAESAVILVGRSTPLDQYVLEHPDYLYGAAPETAAIDPDNLVIRVHQMKCSAFELPFKVGERFGAGDGEDDTGAVLEFLATEAGILRRADDRFLWAARGSPAESVSLDASDVDNVVIHDEVGKATLAEIDRASAQAMVHTGAIYQHEGRTWHVSELDWEGRVARVRPVDVDYYTEANVEVDVTLLVVDREERLAAGRAILSDVTVRKTVTMFQKLRFHTRENVGRGPVHLPAEELETDAFIVIVDVELANRVGLMRGGNARALYGVAGLVRQIAPLYVRAAPSDFGHAAEIKSARFEASTMYLFDEHPGGVGLCEAVFDGRVEILSACLDVLERCRCGEGCPGCIGPGNGGAAAKRIARDLVRGLLP